MTQFGDFSKKTNDLFGKSGFDAGSFKVKQTLVTPPVLGGKVTVSEEITGIDDFSKGFSGKISAKWKHACGFSIDKFDNDKKKGTVLDMSYSKFPVPGLKASCGWTSKGKMPVACEYANDVVAAKFSTDAGSFSSCTADLCLSSEGIMVGSSLSLSNSKGSFAVKDYPISLGYSGNGYTAAVEATDKLKKFTLLGNLSVSKELTVGSKFQVPDGGKEMFGVVGVYKLGDEYNTKVACQFGYETGKSDKAIDVGVTTKPLKGVEAVCALNLPLANASKYTCGFGLTLG
mmetsp:Transcript_66785/g.150843  ORF Transcript_66785/g.150843 Transcript_66785/m.150843 type:complete len:287 (-) Transcript_66785:279-1139(-)|eukprot:CAMPEP_0172583046 /NCGR_PEP_ID=MMETSP1068-20121228/2626_1 /TAXON_ID=35684 /ORGANISM="Pseudopedinella elastica, Strain CCMP716" /LENGTH=286 /DNA_ID=CAMNT_0013376683 /DNA_START=296 /DNA_END=1156 /DNA_ORIENTATION=-